MEYIDSYEIFEARQVTKNYMLKSLKNNFCAFMYKKKSGEKRYAFGTLMPKYLKKVWRPTGAKSTAPPNNIVYWDLAKKNFRQFNPDEFIRMVDKKQDIVDFANNHKEIYNKLKVHFPRKKKPVVKNAASSSVSGNTASDENSESVNERMKIMPITNDEFNKASGSIQNIPHTSRVILMEIENPTYNDILVPGNVVVTKEKKDNIYICWGVYDQHNNSNILSLHAGSEYVMVCRTDNLLIPYSYLECSDYIENFPESDNISEYDILSVYRTNIDISKIKSVYEFLNLFDNIKIK